MWKKRTLPRAVALLLVAVVGAFLTALLPFGSNHSKAQPPSNRAALRARVIALKVKIGPLQFDLENDREKIREARKNPGFTPINNEGLRAEIDEECRIASDAELSKMMRTMGENPKIDKDRATKLATSFDAAVKSRDSALRDKIAGELKTHLYDCLSEPDQELIARQTYAKQLEVIADEELQLEDELKLYREAR